MSDKTELLPCPFCGCSMKVVSNRDWHRAIGDHSDNCPLTGHDDMMMTPASDEELALMLRDWNTRVAPPEDVRVVVDEPVAYVMPMQIEAMKSVGWMHASRDKGHTGLEVGLYRHPMVLPERKPQRVTDAFAEGWNACLDLIADLNK